MIAWRSCRSCRSRAVIDEDHPRRRSPRPRRRDRAGPDRGGLACFPVNGTYRLAADATSDAAITRLAQSKASAQPPALVLVSDLGATRSIVDGASWPLTQRLAAKLWPGRSRSRCRRATSSPASSASSSPARPGPSACASPMIRSPRTCCARSAGRCSCRARTSSASPARSSAATVRQRFIGAVDVWVDAGDITPAAASTIVELTETSWKVVRDGAVPLARLERTQPPDDRAALAPRDRHDRGRSEPLPLARPYVAMMPAALPWHLALVYISGVAEVAGGLGLLVPRTRRAAAWGLIALFIAVFPANVNMAVNELPLGTKAVPTWALWARLPLQLVLIAWAYAVRGPRRIGPLRHDHVAAARPSPARRHPARLVDPPAVRGPRGVRAALRRRVRPAPAGLSADDHGERPAAVREVFTAGADDVHAGEANKLLEVGLGRHSLLLLDGAAHLRERKLAMPPFHGERMRAYGTIMREVADRVIDSWPEGTRSPCSRRCRTSRST